MRVLKTLAAATCALVALVVFAGASPAQAQAPHYLDALTDLRTARDYISWDQRPGTAGQRRETIGAINKAIEAIKHAAWDDGKNTKYAQPSGANGDPWLGFRKADFWLGVALKNMYGHDNPANEGFRADAYGHIHEAQQMVEALLQHR
jgi:hypothetical protein